MVDNNYAEENFDTAGPISTGLGTNISMYMKPTAILFAMDCVCQTDRQQMRHVLFPELFLAVISKDKTKQHF